MDESSQILIAEGEGPVALEMQRALRLKGYDVPIIVSSGEAAVEKAEELCPNLVLMDTVLEGEMGGVEAAGQILTRFDIPVVYFTADINEAKLEAIKRTQPFGCVFKPFKDVELQAAVEIALYKHAEDKRLRESEKRLRLIADNMRDMVRLTDTEGKNTYFTPSHEAVLGYTPEDRVRRSIFEMIHPDDKERVRQIFTEALALSKPGRAEYRARHAGGHYVWVETIGDFVYDGEERTAGILMSTRDITERRAMEAALRESEEKYRTILESIEDGYWEVDLTGRFTFFNDELCRMLDIPAEELMGVQTREYTPLETVKEIYTAFNEIYRTGKPAKIVNHEIIKKDKSRVTHELSVSLMRDEKENPVGFRGVSRDVTFRKQAEEEIQAQREHLALINQILRHDLTNDLVVIQSALNLYARSPEENFLSEASGRIKKSLDLISRMKELESFMSSHRELKTYKIRDIVSEVARGYPSIDFVIKGKARVMADESLFSVIDNITRNAFVHGRAGRIEITIDRQEEMCEVRIADNGYGIPDEIKEAIFEEGFIYGDTGQTGLGLHMVKKVMKSYGGYAYAQDNKPNGAVFVLRFKMVE